LNLRYLFFLFKENKKKGASLKEQAERERQLELEKLKAETEKLKRAASDRNMIELSTLEAEVNKSDVFMILFIITEHFRLPKGKERAGASAG
jgi:hypothetical protein